jgi:hypothetical protein
VLLTQQLGHLAAGRDGADLRAKRLRYRYLVVPALVAHGARQLTIRLPASYPRLDRFVAAPPAAQTPRSPSRPDRSPAATTPTTTRPWPTTFSPRPALLTTSPHRLTARLTRSPPPYRWI